ncbi:MAG: alpha/beta fold hydrolase [Bacteroidota bacterium]|nr:alpha/beta fold hydrolase [Bacteroidota bacterium]MDP4273548.1 alpha/beta fold hydrolase [Bacteroidota bacterium]
MNLFFREFGEGLPVIILHGLYGSSDNWLSLGKIMAENYHVYLLDQRNHGKSPHSKIHTYNAMQDDLLEFMDSKKLDKVNLIGHSMGGKTAMYFAIMHPERTASLTVVDIAPRSYQSLNRFSENSIFHLNVLNALLSIQPEKIKARHEAAEILSQTIKEERVVNFLLKNLKYKKERGFYWSINLDALAQNLPNILGGIKEDILEKGFNQSPVMFIKGGNSSYIGEADLPLIKKVFPSAEIEIIPGASHWVHAEKPKEFLNYVLTFLKNQ